MSPTTSTRIRLVLWLALLLAGARYLSSCALLEGQPWHPPVVRNDSARTLIVAKNYYAGTYKDRSDHRAQDGGTFVAKANAPLATGTSQAQDNTRTGQHGGAVATAPGATAGATTRTGFPPWALAAGAVVLLLLLLGALVYRYRRRVAALL
ncbi:MAG: hypothetical protein ACRYFX_09730 [Janthinobacterium lividum]